MSRSLTFVSLLLFLFLASCSLTVQASSCIVMDTAYNLYLLNNGGKDYNLGSQSSWTSTSSNATDVTAPGRPPFDTPTCQCFKVEFVDAIYCLAVDASDMSAVYIYNVEAGSWSKQSTNTPTNAGGNSFNPNNFKAIDDHDTGVLYAFSDKLELWYLDLNSTTAASPAPANWTDVGQQPWASGQTSLPVMAIADNHIYVIDLNDLQPGQANIFVIHFSYFQPAEQMYNPVAGNPFPQAAGQVASIPLESNLVQQQFAYFPNGINNTFVIDVISNTSQIMTGPPIADENATYVAGPTAIVQLTSSGQLNFIPFSPNDTGSAGANSQAAWQKILNAPAPVPSSTSNSSNSSGTGVSAQTASGSPSSPSGSSSGAVGQNAPLFMAIFLGVLAAFSLF